MSLSEDPRWQRFNNSERPCPCCGRTFSGVFDIGFDHPQPWPHGNREQSDQDVLAVGKDSLSADLCRFVATRDDLARRWHDLIDINAGRIITEGLTTEAMGQAMFEQILVTASGKKSKAEQLGLANQLALFNPGPVT